MQLDFCRGSSWGICFEWVGFGKIPKGWEHVWHLWSTTYLAYTELTLMFIIAITPVASESWVLNRRETFRGLWVCCDMFWMLVQNQLSLTEAKICQFFTAWSQKIQLCPSYRSHSRLLWSLCWQWNGWWRSISFLQAHWGMISLPPHLWRPNKTFTLLDRSTSLPSFARWYLNWYFFCKPAYFPRSDLRSPEQLITMVHENKTWGELFPLRWVRHEVGNIFPRHLWKWDSNVPFYPPQG